MSTYTILQKDGISLPVEPNHFMKQLQLTWPSVVIDVVVEPVNINMLQWVIHEEGLELDGQLRRDFSAISLNGGMSDSAAFALWCNNILAVSGLVIYDESFDQSIELTPDTTIVDIVSNFSN